MCVDSKGQMRLRLVAESVSAVDARLKVRAVVTLQPYHHHGFEKIEENSAKKIVEWLVSDAVK